MEYQKIMNLLDNTSNQPYVFRSKNWVEINDDVRGTYSKDSEINKFILTLQNQVYVIIVMHIYL